MSLLDAHLEQIELCSSTIRDLPFPPPRMFTNALLHNSDITALIRDTEAHERALFVIAPPAIGGGYDDDSASRVSSLHVNLPSIETTFKAPRRNAAVATVLGGDLAERIQREHAGAGARGGSSIQPEKLDVELLLKGAERLCAIYQTPGAMDRIAAIRSRYKKAQESIAQYEVRVAEQTDQLRKFNRPTSSAADDDADIAEGESGPLTQEDLKETERTIKELEATKQTLTERVEGMEKDLEGLRR